MLKHLHKVLTVGFFAFMLLCPISFAQNDTIPVARDVDGQMELIQNEINVEDSNVEPINTKDVKNTVVPDPKKEGKKVIGLFLKTMMAVAFCAIALYIILLFVKKFYSSAFINRENDELEVFDLSTPSNKEDALKSFLNRTK